MSVSIIQSKLFPMLKIHSHAYPVGAANSICLNPHSQYFFHLFFFTNVLPSMFLISRNSAIYPQLHKPDTLASCLVHSSFRLPSFNATSLPPTVCSLLCVLDSSTSYQCNSAYSPDFLHDQYSCPLTASSLPYHPLYPSSLTVRVFF